MSNLYVENVAKEIAIDAEQSFAEIVKALKLKHIVAAKTGNDILDLSASVGDCQNVRFLEATDKDE